MSERWRKAIAVGIVSGVIMAYWLAPSMSIALSFVAGALAVASAIVWVAWRNSRRGVFCVILLAALVACGGQSPVAPAPAPDPFDFSGRWTGSIMLAGGACWVPGTCTQGNHWSIVVNLVSTNFVWKENCPFACAKLNVEREGTFTTSASVASVTFTAPDLGSATLLPAGECLAGTFNVSGKVGSVSVCR